MGKPQATVDRAIVLRTRADLVASAVEGVGATTWIVKDPLTLEHFQFSAEEYGLVEWLREPVSIAELQRLFQRRFAPQTITVTAIWEFLSRLHAAGLLISDATGQGYELLERRKRETIRKAAYSWTGLLGIRFRGVDPDRFLSAVQARFHWLFSPLVFAAVFAMVLYAASLVLGHFDEFRNRLPELSALTDWRNLPWLLLAIGVAKTLHELGHALMCKYYGGEVRELGMMLLVFAPCLYCDVTDAWRFRSRWQRMAVSAAGVLVELCLAAAATIVWWYAQPGVVQLVALNIMVICTLNTMLINGNPLLRYDGYYIFSDFMEVPNLWQRSREALRYFWSEWLLGQPTTVDALLPARQRPWLAGYAIASKIYLTMVCVLIVWGLAKSFAPYHLENLAYAVGLTVLGSALIAPVKSVVELVRNPVQRAEMRRGRAALVAAVGLAVVVGVLAFPVDYNVSAPLLLLPTDAARVYATAEGTLQNMLPAGSKVSQGESIGQLTNVGTDIEIARLEGECKLRQLHLEHLERLRGVDHEANDQLPTARTQLADSQRRLEERRSEAQRLTLRSPMDGVVIPAPRVAQINRGEGRLREWMGSLADEAARGARVRPGTLTCLVGDPKQLSAVLLVDDADVKFLQPGQRARLSVEQLPGQIIEGEVVEVARHEASDSDRAKNAKDDLTALRAGLVSPEHEGAHYEVRVRLDDTPRPELVIGGRGEAKVATERVTLARRISRYLAQTFRLPI
jgi:putative peptide zinc metalloprotease protein